MAAEHGLSEMNVLPGYLPVREETRYIGDQQNNQEIIRRSANIVGLYMNGREP